MSLRFEQYTALKKTRYFLRVLLSGDYKLSKTALREQAYRCIKHFPHLNENGLPIFSTDEFTDNDGRAVVK